MSALGPVIAAIFLTVGCTSPNAGDNAIHPDMLLLLPGAEDVKYTRDYDGTVSYRLTEPYPAEATLERIRTRLEGQGWRAVVEDLMNPGITNSHERGWMNFIDATRNSANVFLWSAAWENNRGDRVEYWLRYDFAKGAGPESGNPPLQLSAIYMSAPTVKVIREGVRRRGAAESRQER